MTTAPERVSSVPRQAGPGRPPRRWRNLSLARALITPVVLLAVLGMLALYLHHIQLDEIERRSINGTVIRQCLWQHIRLVLISSAAVVLIAVPLGVALTRRGARWAAIPILGVANVGQSVPSIGVLVLLAVTVGIGFQKAVIALVLVSILPVLRNTMIGLASVDKSLIDAGRGMGLTKTAVLLGTELPLAVPVILAGIRVALIVNVSSATLATFTNAGGLGTLIETGISVNRFPVLLTGSVLTAVLALAVDWLAGLAEQVLRPKGI